MIEFRLKAFRVVARHRSFSRAARELGLTQPAVTNQIRLLEEQYGVQLFDRLANRIELTAAGRALQETADQLLDEAEKIEDRLRSFATQPAGPLVIGASSTIGDYLLPQVLGVMKKRRPALDLRVSVGNTDQIVTWLADHLIDIAVVEGSTPARGLERLPYVDDELVVIVYPDHPLAGRKEITPADLDRESFIIREEGSGTGEFIRGMVRKKEINIPDENIALELGSSTAIKGAVRAGLGVSILSLRAVQDEIRSGALFALRIKGRPMIRKLTFLARKSRFSAPHINEFVTLCIEETPPLAD